MHRFNKAQQDAILPHVENGTIVFIGATTENPSFEVIAPLLSRARVLTLQPLTDEQMTRVIEAAVTDSERGLGKERVQLEAEALQFLLDVASGDARVALNAVEISAQIAPVGSDGARPVDRALIEEVLQRRSPMYDKGGDSHYDTISAFIKSLRGSDPGATNSRDLARRSRPTRDRVFSVDFARATIPGNPLKLTPRAPAKGLSFFPHLKSKKDLQMQ